MYMGKGTACDQVVGNNENKVKSSLALDTDDWEASLRYNLSSSTPDLTGGRLGVGCPTKPSTGSSPVARSPCGWPRRWLGLLLRNCLGRKRSVAVLDRTAASPAEHSWGGRRTLCGAPLLHESFAELR